MHLTKYMQYLLCRRRNALVFFSETTSAGLQEFLWCPLRLVPHLCYMKT